MCDRRWRADLRREHHARRRRPCRRQSETIAGETHAGPYADADGHLSVSSRATACRSRTGRDANGNRLPPRSTRATGCCRPATDLRTAAGELASRTDTAAGATTSYAWDALGRLTAVTQPDGRRSVCSTRTGSASEAWARLVRRSLGRRSRSPKPTATATSTRFVWAGRLPAPDLVLKDGATYRVVRDHLGAPLVVTPQRRNRPAPRRRVRRDHARHDPASSRSASRRPRRSRHRPRPLRLARVRPAARTVDLARSGALRRRRRAPLRLRGRRSGQSRRSLWARLDGGSVRRGHADHAVRRRHLGPQHAVGSRPRPGRLRLQARHGLPRRSDRRWAAGVGGGINVAHGHGDWSGNSTTAPLRSAPSTSAASTASRAATTAGSAAAASAPASMASTSAITRAARTGTDLGDPRRSGC